ncbi:DoxX family protein [Occallatibacter riparius]|uniref:DoxX family protein n=1 Tax=Occallatibacter riparius TaxID=1002689 RepID=A0A9J7BQR1_9BACT|nr:DoxX family protein [Occallatibacter riparius]UWZ85212.1 DoxX family protein [Occallatibacter riparius]
MKRFKWNNKGKGSLILSTVSSAFWRFALGFSFLSADADRFAIWGVFGAPHSRVAHSYWLHSDRRMEPRRQNHSAQRRIPYLEIRMKSNTAQLTGNATEIVRLFARLALGASFLSAVADRFGVLGPHGAKNVSWGDFAHFADYTREVTSLFPSSLTVSFAWAATVAEALFGILLIVGFKTRTVSFLSGILLLLFAMGMATGLGIKAPLDYSVFSAAAAALLLGFWEPDRFTSDKLLNRPPTRKGYPVASHSKVDHVQIAPSNQAN